MEAAIITKNELYHVTKSKNWTSIQENGLIPVFEKGLTVFNNKRLEVVWLTDDPDYILRNQAGRIWISQNEPIVLCVNITDLEVMPYTANHLKSGQITVPHEFYFKGCILPDKITRRRDFTVAHNVLLLHDKFI